MGCDAVKSGRNLLKFVWQRFIDVLYPFSGWKSHFSTVVAFSQCLKILGKIMKIFSLDNQSAG
jgi:hypothetical protein